MNDRSVEAIKANQENLRGLIANVRKLQAEGVSPIHISPLHVEEFKEMENAVTISEVRVPWRNARPIKRQAKDEVLIPCMGIEIAYNYAAFKSKVHETFGDLVEGTRIFIFGYDIEQDAGGNIMLEEIANPEKALAQDQLDAKTITQEQFDEVPATIKRPKLITKDKDGGDLAPQQLMYFSPDWSTDQNKQRFTQLKNEDMLNLAPGTGVPRKKPVTQLGEDKDAKTKPAYFRDKADFNHMPGLQPEIEKPMLNAAEVGDEAMLLFISKIPVGVNAPSRKAERAEANKAKTTLASPVSEAATTMPADPFASTTTA